MDRLINFIDVDLMIVLMITIIISAILWAFLYFNSTWFKSNVAERANQGIVSFLRHSFFRHVASFFINGGLHSIVLLLTIMSIFVLFKFSMTGNPEPTKIQMVFTRKSSIDSSFSSYLNYINLKLIVNSDSLYCKSGKNGRNGISLDYNTVTEDSVDEGLVYLSWDKPSRCYFFRDSTKYSKKPDFKLFQSEDTVAALSIIPTKSDTCSNCSYGMQDIQIVNNSWAPSNDNPYYYYYIALNLPAVTSTNPEAFLSRADYNINIEIQFGDIVNNHTVNILRSDKINGNNMNSVKADTIRFSMPTLAMTDKKFKYTYINPVPDAITNGRIRYYTKESIKKILYGEYITIQAEDIDVMKKNNQESLLWTVLLGMCVGFLLDVIIQQIRELRDVNSKKYDRKKYKIIKKDIFINKKNS